MTSDQYAFGFDKRYVRAARLFGVTPANAVIVVDDRQLRVRFGPWHVATDLDNIRSVAVTGPYAFLKTAGPARLGVTDRGLTFATNSRAGVCLEFHHRIAGIDPAGLIKHPNLTLTPADVAGLAAALSEAPSPPREPAAGGKGL